MVQDFIPAVITPVIDGKPDLASYEKVLLFLKNNGVKKIVALGSTGEGVGLFPNDFVEIMSIVEKTGLECVLCIANPNAYKVWEIIESVKHFNIEAYMITPPFTTKSKQKDIVAYYKFISDHANKPLVIYNNVARFGLNISFDSYKEILVECNIYGIKECAAVEDKLWSELREITLNTDVKLYSGDDDSWIKLDVDGCISVIGNILPSIGVQIANGDLSKINDWNAYCELFKVGLNPANVKYLLSKRNLISDQTWLSFASLSENDKKLLDKIDYLF